MSANVLKNLPISSGNIGVKRNIFSVLHCDEESSMVRVLNSLGFQPIRKHRSKPITLLKSDDSYLLLHHTNSTQQGQSVGVAVSNISQTLEMLEPLSQKGEVELHVSGMVGPLGLRIPAIRLSEGHYVYLIDESEADTFFAFDFTHIK